MLNEIMKFEGLDVRVVGTKDKPLFIAKDICKILGIKNVSMAMVDFTELELMSVKMISGGQRRKLKEINYFRNETKGKSRLLHKTLLETIRDEFTEEIGESELNETHYYMDGAMKS